MEPNQIYILAFPMLGDLQQINDAQESRFSRQHRSDLLKPDLFDRIHLNLAFFHPVPVAGFDMGALPDADAASDSSLPNAFAKPLGEGHFFHNTQVVIAR
jgi:hypothetical protein